MLNLRPFQIVLLVGFALLAIISILLLSSYSPIRSDDETRYGERVAIWGTLPQAAVVGTIREIENSDKAFGVVSYTYIDPRSFNESLLNAIAEGRSPDMILIGSSDLISQRSRLLAIPYTTITERVFRDTYVDGAEIFARPDGIYAIPLVVDPLVLYWNRDIFASHGFAQAPTTWEYITNTIVPSITVRDNNRNILASAIAFGEFRNVLQAKEMLILLAMQAGSKMIVEEQNRYEVGLDTPLGEGREPLTSTAEFFTDFSNSNSQLYSWNRVQSNDRNAFVAGDLALYFGFGSEAEMIQQQNPNLNFDVASMPQGASATIKRTYGEFYGFAIPRASANPSGAFAAAMTLTSADAANAISEGLSFAPVHRSAIAAGSGNPVRQVILNSALIARGWLDPNPAATDEIFQTMIEDITSGRLRVNAAVDDAVQRIQLAF